MTDQQLAKGVLEFPNKLEVLITRKYDAPIQLVFDVFTKEEHMRKTVAPYEEDVTVCTIDHRVGGDYHYVFVTEDGTECSFRGTFLEVEPPTRTVQTWIFDGWPDVKAVETIELAEADGVTTVRWSLRFSDQAGRDHMSAFDGVQANFDNIEKYLRSLLEPSAEAQAEGTS